MGSPAGCRMLSTRKDFLFNNMKKKIISLKLDSFRGDNTILYPTKGKGLTEENLLEVFSKEELELLNKDFDQFSKLVLENCINEESQQLFKRFKKELKQKYLLDMYMEIGATSIYPILQREDASFKQN